MGKSISTLEDEITEHAATVSTNAYSMAVSELISMYADGELDLHPEFQRFFRWTDEQKSRFIESLLLGIPVPPVFVSEKKDSKWDVIDGLQRLSTILQFVGVLKGEKGKKIKPLVLTRAKYLTQLENKVWESKNKSLILPENAKIKLKRSRIDVNIILNTSDDMAKYEIFQRLNTGGTSATDQEIRNCILIMINNSFFAWMKKLCEMECFRSCISLSDRQQLEAFDMELLTRFIVFSNCKEEKLKRIDELSSFLTDNLVSIANDKSFNRKSFEHVFQSVFMYLSDVLGEDSFKKYNDKNNRYQGATSISAFEIVGTGLGYHLLNGGKLPQKEDFLDKHKRIMYDNEVKRYIMPGVRASTRLPKTISFGRKWIK